MKNEEIEGIQASWRHGRSEQYIEVNPEPIEPKIFFNPSIADMLSNPQCMIQKMNNGIYLDDDDEQCKDSWNTDIQDDFTEFDLKLKKPQTVSEPVPATNQESDKDTKEPKGDDTDASDD